MAEISAKMVKELRTATDAPMMDCKKALVEAEGDMEAAKAILRDKGISKAVGKGDRVAAEGLVEVVVADDFKSATIAEVNSETDFVSKNEGFQNLVKETATYFHSSTHTTIEDALNGEYQTSTFGEYFTEATAKIGEKIVSRRFAKLEGDVVNGYVHSNGRVGVLIAIETDKPEELRKIAKDIAMHAAAMRPTTLSYQDFTPEYVAEETKGRIEAIKNENEELARLGKPLKNVPQFISMQQLTDDVLAGAEEAIKAELKAEGKPEKIWDKIVPGKLERFIADNTTLDKEMALLDQNYVMDDSMTIAQALAKEAKKAGASTANLVGYIRYEVGEGIEKKEAMSFAEEVAAQAGK
jgi:elongation factor Ts